METFIFIIAFCFLLMAVLLGKMARRIEDVGLKMDFLEQKIEDGDKKLLAVINGQYTEVMTGVNKAIERVGGFDGKLDDLKEKDFDILYKKAEKIAKEIGRVSAGVLQRRLGVGHSRALRLMKKMEEKGVIAPCGGGLAGMYAVEE